MFLLVYNPLTQLMVVLIPLIQIAVGLQPGIFGDMNVQVCAVNPYYNRLNGWGMTALDKDKEWLGVYEQEVVTTQTAVFLSKLWQLQNMMFGDMEFMYNTYYYTIKDKLYYLFIPYALSILLYSSPLWSVFILPTLGLLILGPWTLISGLVVGIIAGINSGDSYTAFKAFKDPKGKNDLNLVSYIEEDAMPFLQ